MYWKGHTPVDNFVRYMKQNVSPIFKLVLQLWWNKRDTKWAFEHRLLKFDRALVVNLKQITSFLTFIPLAFWIRNYLLANVWEKNISMLAGNLNTGLSYLITTVYFVPIWCIVKTPCWKKYGLWNAFSGAWSFQPFLTIWLLCQPSKGS